MLGNEFERVNRTGNQRNNIMKKSPEQPPDL